MKTVQILMLLTALSLPSCYVYHVQEKALVEGIDMDQTLKVAAAEIEQNRFATVLGIWAIRDQVFTPEQAATVNALYFEHIERIDSEDQKAREFSVWHLAWAVSNIYRLGDDGVKDSIRDAYEDAGERIEKLDKNVATTHYSDEKMTMGDIHLGGRGYAKNHLVVPGNKKYLQSYDEYLEEQKDD